MATETSLKINEIPLFRLDRTQYEALEQRLLYGKCIVDDKTTELRAGYMLGIQYVLKELRDGFTTGV
jgi:hypothetical protein